MTKQQPPNFRALLDAWRFNGPDDQPPRTWSEIAKLLSISAPHLRSLMSGRRSAPDWTVTRIADRLGTTATQIRAALDRTLAEAGRE